MKQLLPLIILGAVLYAIIQVVQALTAKGKPSAELPYQKQPTLFTPAERSFLGVLEQVLGNQFRIMGKIRLADVIRVRPGLDASSRQKAFNRIQSKHLDFVICDPNDLSIQFAIELDDKSHAKKNRQDRDAFLDGAMQAAGVPLIRIPARKAYTIQDITQAIDFTSSAPNAGQDAPPLQTEAVVLNVSTAEPLTDAANLCPKCGGNMVRRTSKRGEHKGSEFWGCSNYPSCRTILPV
jgi:translation initiation factor 2 gamma subunit (eIF-2gamma)